MTKVEDVRARILEARKSGDTRTATVLNTLLAETKTAVLKKENRDITDDDLVRMAAKFMKNLEKTWELKQTEDTRFEMELISTYFPKRAVSHFPVDTFVDELIRDNPGQKVGWYVGQVMKASKGTANPKAVQEKVAEIVSVQ